MFMVDAPCPACWANTRGAAAMAVAAAPVVSMVSLRGSIIGASLNVFLVVGGPSSTGRQSDEAAGHARQASNACDGSGALFFRRVLDRVEAIGLQPQEIPGLQH